jgi:AraC family transcriptional regulator, ethanolamine operon transcriptional activator
MDAGQPDAAQLKQPQRRSTEIFSFDPGAMSLALQDGVLEHVQLERGNFRGQIAHTAAASTRVDWGSYTLSVLARGDLTKEMVTLGMAVAGRGDWRVHGQQIVRGDMVAFPEQGELMVALPPQAQWLTLQVPRTRLESAGLAMTPLLAASARRMRGDMDANLLQALGELAPVLAPHEAKAHFGATDVERAHDELLSVLLSELVRRGGKGDSGASLRPGERWRVIRRAEEYLESTSEASVRIDDLCVAACTSLSRLERAFREAFGVSPRRFLMLRRLAAVRGELLKGNSQSSVTDVATRWGFFHLGRFSQEYRLHYGERPSETSSARRA